MLKLRLTGRVDIGGRLSSWVAAKLRLGLGAYEMSRSSSPAVSSASARTDELLAYRLRFGDDEATLSASLAFFLTRMDFSF